MAEERIETGTCTVWLNEHGVIETKIKPGARQTLEDARQNTEVCKRLAAGKKRPILNDYSEMAGMDKACRDFYASEEVASIYTACGLIVGSKLARAVGSFFMGLNRPKTPTKLFTSRDKAMEWLVKYLPDD